MFWPLVQFGTSSRLKPGRNPKRWNRITSYSNWLNSSCQHVMWDSGQRCHMQQNSTDQYVDGLNGSQRINRLLPVIIKLRCINGVDQNKLNDPVQIQRMYKDPSRLLLQVFEVISCFSNFLSNNIEIITIQNDVKLQEASFCDKPGNSFSFLASFSSLFWFYGAFAA